MALKPGIRLGSYEITALIGTGGMGEVYRATDTKLRRDVAIKVLPDDFTQDPDRLARFAREAQVLASLNHPNIASIYGLEESGATPCLVLELVEGETLGERIARGALPVDEALSIGQQICSALEAAHEKGIIHRDLKPANVKIAPDGTVKVLDFGLAKALHADSSASQGPFSTDETASMSHSPTVTWGGTREGVILGTAPYMSPEQARGKPLDKRTDIWSFGCVLYEMLTRQKTFPGETTADLLASVVKEEPRWDQLPAETPWRVRELLRRCLAKNPAKRLRDAGDARIELDDALTTPELEPGRTQAPRARPGNLRLAVSLLAGALLASAGWWVSGMTGAREAPPAITRLSLAVPDNLYAEGNIRISPDGRVVAYRAVEHPGRALPGARLLLRHLGSEETRTVPGSEGVFIFDFSPDGQWLGFVAPIARQSSRLRVYKASVSGDTPPLAITDWQPTWGTVDVTNGGLVWLPDGDILVLSDRPPQEIVRISSDSGAVKSAGRLPEDVEGYYTLQAALPDGSVLTHRATWDGGYKVAPAVLDPDTGQIDVITDNGARAVFASTGHLVFSRTDGLLAASFDPVRKKLLSGPTSIMSGLRSDGYSFQAWFDLSTDGTLVHLPGGEFGTRRRLVLAGEAGIRSWSNDELRFPEFTTIDVSADGRWLALTLMNEDGLFEIWGSETARPSLRRLAGFPTLDCTSPRWSIDAALLVFECSGGTEPGGVFLLRTTDPEEPKLLLSHTPGEPVFTPLEISPDESQVLVQKGKATGNEILTIPLDGEPPVEPRPVMRGAGVLQDARISPSGTKLAYVSNESGRFEVFVRSRGRDGKLGLAVPVSAGRGVRWVSRPGGKEDLYVWIDVNKFLRFTLSDDLTPSAPTPLSIGETASGTQVLAWDLLPDGTIMAVLPGEDEIPPRNVSVVLGFASELEGLAR